MENGEICFILYKPAVPGNIGAAARAMKTMGFSNLRLIDPVDHLGEEAIMMAHGSKDILDNCTVYPTFDAAVGDIDFIVSTTAKMKSAKVDYISSCDLSQFLRDKREVTRKIGIVFGTEESGLPNTVLQRSNIGVTIPMNVLYPSLNLSQAVMIIAYELAKISPVTKKEKEEKQAKETWSQLQERTSRILEESGIHASTPLYHRIIERMSFMKASDARLAHSLSSRILDKLK